MKNKLHFEMKACKKCGESLPLESFYRQKGMADGRLSFCKACVKARIREHRYKHPDAYVERDRQCFQNKMQKDSFRERRREYDRNYPKDKRRANQKVNNAIRSGKMKRQLCFCGKKAHAHHDDYTKPYDVVWLCPKHHMGVHNGSF